MYLLHAQLQEHSRHAIMSTLFLSSAKCMRKSPMYERLHILKYNSSCIHNKFKINVLCFSIWNDLENEKEASLAEFWWQKKESSRGGSLQINTVQISNIQIVHKDFNLEQKGGNISFIRLWLKFISHKTL